MPAGQMTAHFFRILYIILFVFSTLWVFISIDPSMFDFSQVFNILEYIMLIVQGLVMVMASVAFSIASSITTVKGNIPIIGNLLGGADVSGMSSTIEALVNPDNKFFPHSTTTTPEKFIEDFGNFFGATAILILLPIAILSGIGFLREGDTKLAIYSFLGFQLIIIIAIFTQKIIVSTAIDSSNIFTMIFSPIFTLGFLLYLLLEIAFQTSYTLNILEPMTEREKRIQEHLKRIRTFVPISEEEEKGREQSIQSVQSKKFGLLAASYLRELVERRVFKKGEVVRDAKTTMRLQSYLANLNQSDPQTDQKLAAKTAQPDVSALLKHFIPVMVFRMIAVVALSYFILAPKGILEFLEGLNFFEFPALLQSLELHQPEFQTIVIINVVLLFILFGAILHYLTSGRTGEFLGGAKSLVVQRIETLVDFDRSSKPTPTAGETTEEEAEEAPSDEEEEIS